MEHILLIDDELSVLNTLKLSLFKENYKLHFANCAEEALNVLKKHDVAVIVSDHQMPGKNGVDLLTEIRQLRPDTIRILLTGDCDSVCIIDSINKAHVYLFLSKPVAGKEIRKIIKDAVDKYHEGKIIKQVEDGNLKISEAIQRFSIDKIHSENEFHLSRHLTPGMKIVSDVFDEKGRLIVKAGHVLSRRDIKIMASYPITDRVAITRKVAS